MKCLIPGARVTLEVNRDAIDVSSSGWWYPDLSWRWTDAKGREHRWHQTGTLEGYPVAKLDDLLVWRVDVPETDEYPESGHYEVEDTGEIVEPGWKSTGPTHGTAAGLMRAFIEVEVDGLGAAAPDVGSTQDISTLLSGFSGEVTWTAIEASGRGCIARGNVLNLERK